jgi:hypothetical protein
MTTINKRIGIVYPKTDVHQLSAAAIVLNAYGVAGDALEVSATTHSNIAIAIAAWSAATYDYVLVGTTLAASGTGAVDWSDIDVIITSKLKAASKTAAELVPFKTTATLPDQSAGTNKHIVFDSGASSSDNYYNGKILKITYADLSIQWAYIYDYAGSGKQAYINTAATGTVAGATFEVMDYSAYVIECNTATAAGKLAQIVAWDLIHPNNTIPLAIKVPAVWKWCYSHGTAQAADGTTMTLLETVDASDINGQTVHDTSDTYIGKYAYIRTSTNAKGESALITAYVGSTNVADVDFTTTPTGTIVYGIVENEWQVLLEPYLKMAIMTYLTDLTDSATLANWKLLMDEAGTLSGIHYGTALINQTYFDELVAKGKAMYEAYTKTVTP